SGEADWTGIGGDLWITSPPQPDGDEMLVNGSFTDNADGWTLWSESGAEADGSRDTSEWQSGPAGYRIACSASGTAQNHIQFSHSAPLALSYDQGYVLSYDMKCTAGFDIPVILLLKNGPPWSFYIQEIPGPVTVTGSWTHHTVYMRSAVNADDARLTFFLGGAMPAGSVLHLDNISLKTSGDNPLTLDVGNLIFDEGAAFGVKKWSQEALASPGDFWYDETSDRIVLFSTDNPARVYNSIECALTRHIIDETNRSHVHYENLHLRCGGAHGIGGGNTHHILIRRCDISYIGGGQLKGPWGDTIRYGNGIEFWSNASDNRVEECRLWEIYDAALTNQNTDDNVRQSNITYTRNLIWNAEYSFEYWNRPASSVTDSIFFINNTCVNAGHGWGHAQRPDPAGRHLCFFDNPAATDHFIIENNIFYEAANNAFWIAHLWTGLENLYLGYNCWYQEAGDMIWFQGGTYARDRFADYQASGGKDAHSLCTDPLLADPDLNDFRLTAMSPCIDAGDPASPQDTDGTLIDMGALAFEQNASAVRISDSNLPSAFRLFPNAPNPFNPCTKIRYDLFRKNHVRITIFNLQGECISVPVDEILPPGAHHFLMDASDLETGVYICEISAGAERQTMKMLLLK
ncbi:T9SS type A sorting domain-containing protein, partial [bacterium]|nr:T9SS type A sorting domain-containing protein [bacterium]